MTSPAGGGYDTCMDWSQAWTIIGVLGSLILGVGGIAITVLLSMRSENRIAHEQLGKRIDDGLASVNQRIDDGLAGVHKRIDDSNQRIDDGLAGVHKRIDDLRDLVLTLVRGAAGQTDADQPDQSGQAGRPGV